MELTLLKIEDLYLKKSVYYRQPYPIDNNIVSSIKVPFESKFNVRLQCWIESSIKVRSGIVASIIEVLWSKYEALFIEKNKIKNDFFICF